MEEKQKIRIRITKKINPNYQPKLTNKPNKPNNLIKNPENIKIIKSKGCGCKAK